jgi:hypothetical protein
MPDWLPGRIGQPPAATNSVDRERRARDTTLNWDLIARGPRGIGPAMSNSVRIVRDMTTSRFGWAVEDVVR